MTPYERVADGHGDVGRADQRQQQRNGGADGDTHDDQPASERDRSPRIELAGRDGTMALDGVEPVLGSVTRVVDGVDPRRQQAECGGRQPDANRHAVVAESSCGPGRGDHQRVLHPLLGPHRRGQGAHWTTQRQCACFRGVHQENVWRDPHCGTWK